MEIGFLRCVSIDIFKTPNLAWVFDCRGRRTEFRPARPPKACIPSDLCILCCDLLWKRSLFASPLENIKNWEILCIFQSILELSLHFSKISTKSPLNTRILQKSNQQWRITDRNTKDCPIACGADRFPLIRRDFPRRCPRNWWIPLFHSCPSSSSPILGEYNDKRARIE